MKTMWRRRFLTSVLAATGLCAGCTDLGSLVYFLMPEQKVPAEIKSLATSDKKKEPKAMILVRNGPNTNFEFMAADRELAGALHKQLHELVENNEEHLTLVSQAKIEAFKNSHPNWYQLEPAEIGAHFKVDYVIYVEIKSLSLYDNSYAQMMYRGRAELSVKLVDVKNSDESAPRKDFTCSYPSGANFIMADDPDTPPNVFREKFLAFAAKRLAWYFAPHPIRDSQYIE
jgi:hypothetical protein